MRNIRRFRFNGGYLLVHLERFGEQHQTAQLVWKTFRWQHEFRKIGTQTVVDNTLSAGHQLVVSSVHTRHLQAVPLGSVRRSCQAERRELGEAMTPFN